MNCSNVQNQEMVSLFVKKLTSVAFKIRAGKWIINDCDGSTYEMNICYKLPRPTVETELLAYPFANTEQFCFTGTIQKHRTPEDEFEPQVFPIIGNVFCQFVSFCVMDRTRTVLSYHIVCEMISKTEKQGDFVLIENARGFIIDKKGVKGSCVMVFVSEKSNGVLVDLFG
jgi:hypothetical protein